MAYIKEAREQTNNYKLYQVAWFRETLHVTLCRTSYWGSHLQNIFLNIRKTA